MPGAKERGTDISTEAVNHGAGEYHTFRENISPPPHHFSQDQIKYLKE
jgi:hypothetical protein